MRIPWSCCLQAVQAAIANVLSRCNVIGLLGQIAEPHITQPSQKILLRRPSLSRLLRQTGGLLHLRCHLLHHHRASSNAHLPTNSSAALTRRASPTFQQQIVRHQSINQFHMAWYLTPVCAFNDKICSAPFVAILCNAIPIMWCLSELSLSFEELSNILDTRDIKFPGLKHFV